MTEKPELKSEIQDLYSLAVSEIEEGGSEMHECELAYNDMVELKNELKMKKNEKTRTDRPKQSGHKRQYCFSI